MKTIGRYTTALVLALLLVAPIAGMAPSALADETVPPEGPVVTRTQVEESVIKGLDWFSRTQNFEGSWAGSIGVTGLILMCFTNAGYDYTNQTVQRALEHMRVLYNSEHGWLADAYLNYETAISLIALAAAGDPKDADKLTKMAEFFHYLQFSEDSEYNMTEDWYRGGWPNYAGIPDVSNSQFSILGLMSAELMVDGYSVPDQVYANATAFGNHCQNWPDVNVMPWAHNESLPSHGDGGFVYNAYRSRTPLGEPAFESYGSITGAGYFSYLACGNDDRQPEVAASRAWLDKEYTFDTNPRMENKGTYYYLWSQTRALAMSGQDWVVDGSGKLHDWRAEVVDFWLDMQRPDGSWPGNPETGWREEEPELAGVYAILCMQTAYLMAPDAELTIQVDGSSDVMFIDLAGERLVSDASKGLAVDGDSLTCTDPEVFRKVWVQKPSGGHATITVTGSWSGGRTAEVTRDLGSGPASALVATGGFAGPFGLHVMVLEDAPDMVVEKKGVKLVPGETQVIEFEVSETSGKGPVVRTVLITDAGEGVVADVDVQGVDVAAGGSETIRLTISLDEKVKSTKGWSLVFTSSTAPPVSIPIGLGEEQGTDTGMSLWYMLVVALLVVMVFFFLLLPQVAKRRGEESEPTPEAEDAPEEGPVPEPDVEEEDGGPG
jgi:squalene-hopene/tetraprenyl-beta-curcumene cyclase